MLAVLLLLMMMDQQPQSLSYLFSHGCYLELMRVGGLALVQRTGYFSIANLVAMGYLPVSPMRPLWMKLVQAVTVHPGVLYPQA